MMFKQKGKNKRSNIIWDTMGLMKSHQDVWKERKVCRGPPSTAADVGGELEVTSILLNENTMQLERATTERTKLGRPFAILVLTPQLQIFRNTWGDVSRGEFQCIHILRPFETGASRPMSTHRMERALPGEFK
jgi:hypothetical protein